MTPTDLGITPTVLMGAITTLFETMVPFLLVIIPITAVTLGVKWGLRKVTSAGKGKS